MHTIFLIVECVTLEFQSEITIASKQKKGCHCYIEKKTLENAFICCPLRIQLLLPILSLVSMVCRRCATFLTQLMVNLRQSKWSFIQRNAMVIRLNWLYDNQKRNSRMYELSIAYDHLICLGCTKETARKKWPDFSQMWRFVRSVVCVRHSCDGVRVLWIENGMAVYRVAVSRRNHTISSGIDMPYPHWWCVVHAIWCVVVRIMHHSIWACGIADEPMTRYLNNRYESSRYSLRPDVINECNFFYQFFLKGFDTKWHSSVNRNIITKRINCTCSEYSHSYCATRCICR